MTSPLNNDAEPAALRERVAMLEPNSGDMAERDRLAAEEVTGPLYGPHRVGVRLVMILLSHRGWTAVAIAELLGC